MKGGREEEWKERRKGEREKGWRERRKEGFKNFCVVIW